jgi:hypothetical protein
LQGAAFVVLASRAPVLAIHKIARRTLSAGPGMDDPEFSEFALQS